MCGYKQRANWATFWGTNDSSQAARQGLAVLMASAVAVLKHETSTLRQIYNFTSINLTFGVGDNVREVTKVGSDPMSGRDATWGNIYGSCDLFLFFNGAIAHTREQIFKLKRRGLV